MSLPPFFDRAADAVMPIVAADRAILRARIDEVTPCIRLEDPDMELAFLAAVDLASRFYGRVILEAPDPIREHAMSQAVAINPSVEFPDDSTHRVVFGGKPGTHAGDVAVSVSGWNVIVDRDDLPRSSPAGPAQLAAAAIGIGHLFRCVFAHELARGRTAPEPSSLNLITLREFDELPVPGCFELGKVHLAGSGAIGQAAIASLASANARGEVVLVDHEPLELSNLQRYFGALFADVGIAKTKLAARKLASTGLRAREVQKRWGESRDSAPGRRMVMVALDSGRDRIGVQAGLHDRIANAFTGPNDFGWSRHEHFGTKACLACLYWPTGERPHRYQVIANALGQHESRIRLYRASGHPIGSPLMPMQLPANMLQPDPTELGRWFQVSLLADIADRFGLDEAGRVEWALRTVDDFDRAMCGGTIVRVDGASADAIVPLAHQSLLAGVMLAVLTLASADSDLQHHLGGYTQGRWDVRRGLHAVSTEVTSLTEGCICSDPMFVSVARRDARRSSV